MINCKIEGRKYENKNLISFSYYKKKKKTNNVFMYIHKNFLLYNKVF